MYSKRSVLLLCLRCKLADPLFVQHVRVLFVYKDYWFEPNPSLFHQTYAWSLTLARWHKKVAHAKWNTFYKYAEQYVIKCNACVCDLDFCPTADHKQLPVCGLARVTAG